jgi:hypothetical protein
MVDTVMVPGTAATLMTVESGFVVVLIALIAAVVWVARRTAEEVRRTAAAEWEERANTAAPSESPRIAA